MPIEYLKGDLLTANVEAIAHGCNTKGAMGAGIAKAIRQKYPRMFEEYRRRCQQGTFKLGEVFLWPHDRPFVFNLAIKEDPQQRAYLTAIRQSFTTTLELCHSMNVRSLGLPKIGSGLGRLPWDDVKIVLEEVVNSSLLPLPRIIVFTI